ncbi:hypothetical protein Ddc_11071 [Ditylenchus destructor]|nr:hypothetical protein Ddc_11071 [Ditylenchus destructor]
MDRLPYFRDFSTTHYIPKFGFAYTATWPSYSRIYVDSALPNTDADEGMVLLTDWHGPRNRTVVALQPSLADLVAAQISQLCEILQTSGDVQEIVLRRGRGQFLKIWSIGYDKQNDAIYVVRRRWHLNESHCDTVLIPSILCDRVVCA